MIALTPRQHEILDELARSWARLETALAGDDRAEVAAAARSLEVDAMHLRLTLGSAGPR